MLLSFNINVSGNSIDVNIIEQPNKKRPHVHGYSNKLLQEEKIEESSFLVLQFKQTTVKN